MQAINRRIGTSPGPLAMRGTVRPRYSGKILCYLCHLCQILNRLQQVNRRSVTAVQAILNVALPIFGVILAGYLAGRWRILGGEATTALNAFVSYFALPVLFFGTLARTPVGAVLDPAPDAGLRRWPWWRPSPSACSRPGWFRGGPQRRARRHEPAGHRRLVGQCRLHGRAALPRRLRRGRPAARHAGGDRDRRSSRWCSASC